MRDLRVAQIMTTPVVTLQQSESMPGAGALMRDGRMRHLPVVDDKERLIGLVTHRDLLRAQVGGTTGLSQEDRDEIQLDVPVEHIMRRHVWTVRPEQTAFDAARLLHDLGFGCAPVVDGEKRVVGIVTEADFLELSVELLDGDHGLLVDHLMSTELVTLAPDEELAVADTIMKLERVRHLPVVEDGALIGLVTHRDLLGARRSNLSSAPVYSSRARARDIMQKDVDTVELGVTAAAAARLLIDHKYGCLPVVQDGSVIGIVTEADFLAAVVGKLAAHKETPRHDAPVNYYMSEPVHAVQLTDNLLEAQATMQRHRVTGLAVVDDQGVLRGALSRTDLLRVRGRGDGPAADRELLSLPNQRVETVTRGAVFTVRPTTKIVSAAGRMLRRGVHRLFVIDDQRRPVGLVSTTDLMLAVRDFELDAPVATYASSPIFSIAADETIEHAMTLIDVAAVSGVIVRDGVWPVGFFTQEEALAARERPAETPISQVMSQEIICVPGDMPIRLAAGQAAALRVRRVIVMKKGHAAGILTGMDFARALAAAR
jgi:CBS domain-containing membrane protein